MDIFKNPIVIGLTAGAATYGYLLMTINEKNEKNEKKKGKKKEKESVNLLIPLIVAIIAWFIAYAYFEYNTNQPHNQLIQDINPLQRPVVPIPYPPSPKYNFVKDVLSESSDPHSFSLITQGVTIPTKLPEVLLEMY